jgi:UDP-glucose 4-epimerase
MKILCLGSSGFAGKVILDSFLQEGDWKVEGINSSQLDLTESKSVQNLSEKLSDETTLIYSARSKNFKTPWEQLNNELNMVYNLSSALLQKRIRKCIYFSTLAVYDDSNSQQNISENTGVLPQSSYGIAKFAGECLLTQAATKMEVPLVIFRSCKLYGPGDPNLEYGPGSFICSALKGETIQLYGDGSELRDHLFVEDLIKIVHHFVQSNESGVYNLASGVSRTYQDLLTLIRAVSKKEFQVSSISRTRSQIDQTVNVSKLKKTFPGLKLTPLEKGIPKTYRDIECRLSNGTLH